MSTPLTPSTPPPNDIEKDSQINTQRHTEVAASLNQNQHTAALEIPPALFTTLRYGDSALYVLPDCTTVF